MTLRLLYGDLQLVRQQEKVVRGQVAEKMIASYSITYFTTYICHSCVLADNKANKTQGAALARNYVSKRASPASPAPALRSQ